VTALEENYLMVKRLLLFKEILLFPSRNLIYVIPATVLFGLVWGYFNDTSSFKTLILPIVVLMVYPSMIGFNLSELAHLQEWF